MSHDAPDEEIVAYPEMNGINILTDVRHGTRRNSKYTDIICIGTESHKVLRIETITRADKPCAQKHELVGTNKIYDYLKIKKVAVFLLLCTVMTET